MKATEFEKTNAFLLGNLAPDGCDSAEERYRSHFRIVHCDGNKTLDLAAFRDRYLNDEKRDDFAIGYYCHLISDLLFRKIMYHECRLNSELIRKSDNLYRDYRLLNRTLICRYELKDEIVPDSIAEAHGLTACFNLKLQDVIDQLREDFKDSEGTEPAYFTEETAHKLIDLATEICIKEIKGAFKDKENQQKLNICW